jgi:hypothetical protein
MPNDTLGSAVLHRLARRMTAGPPAVGGGGGGQRFLLTDQRPLVAGAYTLTLGIGKSARDVPIRLSIG